MGHSAPAPLHAVRVIVLLSGVLGGLAPATGAETVRVPNPSFEEGAEAPAGWTLSGGQGAWSDQGYRGDRSITVTGTGRSGESNYWRGDVTLRPLSTYRLRFRARRVDGHGGCPTSGPIFCNRDLSSLSTDWTEVTSHFVTPSDLSPSGSWLRFGQWEVSGTVAYDDVELVPAQPVYRRRGDIVLGDGEQITGREYRFRAPLTTASHNHARPLVRLTAGYNAPRLLIGPGSEVVYRLDVEGCRHETAQLDVHVGYHVAGEVVVEATGDGGAWAEVGVVDAVGSRSFDLPRSTLPATAPRVRLKGRARGGAGATGPCSLQVHGFTFRSTLDSAPGDQRGATRFLAVVGSDRELDVEVVDLGEAVPGGENTLVARVRSLSGEPRELHAGWTLTPAAGAATIYRAPLEVSKDGGELRLPYELRRAGRITATLDLGPGSAFRAEAQIDVPALHDGSYGALVPGSGRGVALWTTSSGWKISRRRPPPTDRQPAVRVAAARGETEAVQLVVRPSRPLSGLTVPIGESGVELRGPGGSRLAARDVIEVLRVAYVPVTHPTDRSGCAGAWPDPLPPLDGPVDLEADRNQPLWIRVSVPRAAAAGVWRGAIPLRAEGGFRVDVPLEIEVWDFELPRRMTCTTAFGFSAGLAMRYHGVRRPEDRRRVYESYLDTLSAHHISPYDPAALDPLRVSWPRTDGWQGGLRDREVRHTGAASLKLEDASPTRGESAVHERRVGIPDGGLSLSFRHRAGGDGHPFIVTLLSYDEDGRWMSGRNIDIRVEGSTEWRRFERVIREFPTGARSVQLRLWATLYAEDGSTTGTVWFDDVLLRDAATGSVRIRGDFEPLSPRDLRPRIDWSRWDAAMRRAVDERGFNSFRLSIPGMGGGTFHARYEPELLGYGEETPEYRAAFTAYCREVEAHLRERGWLDEAFVYWFDEPDPKDYDFVLRGFRRLREAAPGLRRMLTEQVEPGLVDGPDIWCPLTPAFDAEVAAERRAKGESFWWYVCTGPKEPYATLFIDHPATEMRVWLWQTWKRRIDGILVWQTNYWTSGAAYPDPERPQDPYEDPMGWRSGYSTPPGTRAAWGNGDGRFIYPPLAAADGRPDAPVLDPPVDSIRLEMLRDGLEDYEYLAMLERRLASSGGELPPTERAALRALLDVPPEVSADLTHFTRDPEPIERRRAQVARALARLGAR